MSDTEPTSDYEVLTEAEWQALVANVLAGCGATLDQLQAMEQRGRFDTEAQRRASFVVRGEWA